MSAETKAALDKAVREHIADEAPDKPLVAGWVLACETVALEMDEHEIAGGSSYFLVTMDGLLSSAALGISEVNYRLRSATRAR